MTTQSKKFNAAQLAKIRLKRPENAQTESVNSDERSDTWVRLCGYGGAGGIRLCAV
jgi:hypothetical protein